MRVYDINGNRVKGLSLGLGIDKGSIIQVIGSGGKTSFIKCIANENKDKKVAVLTTTKRYKPMDFFVEGNKDISINLSSIKGNYIEAGEDLKNGKIGWCFEHNFKIIRDWADIILIEADGSKNMPIKALADFEPVLVKEANKTIVLSGLSALNKPLYKACHRFELVLDRYKREHIIDVDTIGYLLNRYYINPYKSLKPVVILNQGDNDRLINYGIKILRSNSFKGFITAFKE